MRGMHVRLCLASRQCWAASDAASNAGDGTMKNQGSLRRQANLATCSLTHPAGTNSERTGKRSLRAWMRALHCLGDEGSSLIEFALVLPMLLLLLTGISTAGVAMNNYLQLTESVTSGARLLAVSRGNTLDPCATSVAAVYAAAPGLTQSKFTFTFVLNGTTYNGTSCSSSSTTTGAAGNLVQGGTARLTATYPCNLSVYGRNYAPTCTLTAQTTELVQ